MEVGSMAHQAQLLNKLAILTCFLIASCGKTKVLEKGCFNIEEVRIVTKKGISTMDNKPINGIVYSLYPSKDTQFIHSYLNGKEDGAWKKFYDNENIKEERTFANGLKDGTMKAYWRGGELKLEYHIKNDVYEGINRIWNPDGTMIQEMNYHIGQELGSQKVWYDNGKIKSNYIIKNGRRYGLLGTKNCTNVSDTIKLK
jgi:antitoxin component YwqK of YwqJK toxin-antitoxin module